MQSTSTVQVLSNSIASMMFSIHPASSFCSFFRLFSSHLLGGRIHRGSYLLVYNFNT